MKPGCRIDVIHHITCRHQVEVEVAPPRAELYFGDERWTDLIDTQIRFEATVFNSDLGVRWQVYDAAGGPGTGTIDATGLYQAPPKGGLKSGHTDVVVATSIEDPLRKAYAWVTLIGEGPLPAPEPRIEIWPKRANVYYLGTAYIDQSNKIQLFRANVWHSDDETVEWLVDGVIQPAQPPVMPRAFLYEAPLASSTSLPSKPVIVRARIKSNWDVYDEAQVVLLDYIWTSHGAEAISP